MNEADPKMSQLRIHSVYACKNSPGYGPGPLHR